MTTLVEEEPYAAAVFTSLISSTCAKCFACGGSEIVKLSRCAGCHIFYYCSIKCQKADWKDHKAECKSFRASKEVPPEVVRLAARMIRKSRSKPDIKSFNGRTYDSLSTVAPKNLDFYTTATDAYISLQSFMGPETPTFQTALAVFSKCARNALWIWDSTLLCFGRGLAIYLGLSVHQHSCRPDAFFVFSRSNLLLRTTDKNCTYNEKITVSQPNIRFFRDTATRRAHLSIFGIDCNCEECKDEEADKKRTSGRPSCCPKGWFSITNCRCSICDKEIPVQRKNAALRANMTLREEVGHWVGAARMKHFANRSDIAPKYIALFERFKEVLSDENTYLMEIAERIQSLMMLENISDASVTLKYVMFCMPQTRIRPYCLYSIYILCRRFVLYVKTKKSYQEIKSVLHEALKTVEVVCGADHELTQTLKMKQVELGFADRLNID